MSETVLYTRFLIYSFSGFSEKFTSSDMYKISFSHENLFWPGAVMITFANDKLIKMKRRIILIG